MYHSHLSCSTSISKLAFTAVPGKENGKMQLEIIATELYYDQYEFLLNI